MSMGSKSQTSLGGATLMALQQIAAEAPELTPENDPLPFDVKWHDAFSCWAGKNGTGVTGSVVLIFMDTPQIAGTQCGADIVYQFGASDTVKPGVYIVGRSPDNNAWRLKHTGADHQTNCSIIDHAGYANNYAIVLGVAQSHLLLLPNGIAGQSIKMKIDGEGTPLDEQTLDKHLEAFAEECLNGQEYRSHIWDDAPKWVPVEHAEKEIQKLLICGLRTAFIGLSVLAETPLSNGRTDVFILSKDPSDARRAVLELKVARSKNSSGNKVPNSTVLNHLKDGITQALEYRKKLGANHASLCAYDMRLVKADTIIDQIKQQCKKDDVKLRVYDIHNTAKLVRTAANESMTP